MSLESVRSKVQSLTYTEGRASLHSKNPDDFEYYALTFELVDSNFNALQIFNFPVMPNGINTTRMSPLNIKKTGHGYFMQYDDNFQSYNITIQGTFGRKFRLITNNLSDGKKLKDYDLKVKTGYGVTKILEKMILSSQQPIESKTSSSDHKFLLFYNLAFNQQFVVEIVNFSFNQSLENNMMWNYSIEMRAVGDIRQLSGFDSNKNLKNLLKSAKLNKQLNTVFNNITAGGIFKSRAQINNELISF